MFLCTAEWQLKYNDNFYSELVLKRKILSYFFTDHFHSKTKTFLMNWLVHQKYITGTLQELLLTSYSIITTFGLCYK